MGKTSPAQARRYLSAAITDERSVVAYNTGHAQDDEFVTGHVTRPAVRLAAIYPNDATIESDNPIIVLDAPWSSPTARAGARMFTSFALQRATQAKVAAAGFRPGSGALRADLLSRANGVDPTARGASVAPASPAAIELALTHWQSIRRQANLLVLFDVSDSMGDAADPEEPERSTKLALAQPALSAGLDQLAPGDNVGLRIFSTGLPNPVSPNWFDVVPRGPFGTRRDALRKAITALTPRLGSPLYAATRDAYDSVARTADPQRINGVVVLTDGYNETDHDNSYTALIAHLGSNPNVRVFTITYSNDADGGTLRRMAQATNAWNFDARNTMDLAQVLPRTLASF